MKRSLLIIIRCLDVCTTVDEDLRQRPILPRHTRNYLDGPLRHQPVRIVRPDVVECYR